MEETRHERQQKLTATHNAGHKLRHFDVFKFEKLYEEQLFIQEQ